VYKALGPVFTKLHFLETYEWTQQAKVLHNAILERLAGDESSSWMDPFVSYERKSFANTTPGLLGNCPLGAIHG